MSDISEWYVPSSKYITKKGGSLLIPVEPVHGNRKKACTMQVRLDTEQIKQLRQLLDEHEDRDRLIDIAEAEMEAFEQVQKAELQEKKKELREKLGLEGDTDLPWSLK